jgi:hypothetical protein
VLGENGDARVGQDVPFELVTQSHSLPRAVSPEAGCRHPEALAA